ncbi:MAG: hypothetical protein COB84_09090 [Rhodobacteraceae bacterium]|nr:MAG: hypothetical protein COB84_09090 [Paracoccaceae bacterium]
MPVQENVLSWEAVAPNWTSIEAGVTHDMGDISATISFNDQEGGDADAFVVDQTVFASADEDADSSLKLYSDYGSDGDYDPTITATIDFSANTGSELSDNVDNVYFRIDGLDMSADYADAVTITAFDAEGNPVEVTLTPTTAQTVTGDTATGTGGTYGSEEALSSLVVSIAGPVSQIVIEYGSAGEGAHQINVGDIYFDTLDEIEDDLIVDGTDDDDIMAIGYVDGDDDTIDGADGDDDIIYGYAGDDTITGGDGADEIYGGDDADTIQLNSDEFDGDDIYGGEGGDDYDTLDTVGTPEDIEIVFDGDESGTVETPNGDIAEFAEIEAVETGAGDDVVDAEDTTGGVDITTNDGSDTVIGGSGDDVINTSGGNDDAIDTGFDAPSPYDIFDIDPDADPSDDLDVVYGGAGNDDITTGDDADTIYGGTGDDTIDSGIDDDYVEGGDGDDVINAGQGADEVYGGDGNDTINTGIDTFTDYENDDPTFPFIDPNTTDGSDTVYGGAGEDVITTGDDADTIYGGADNDTIDGGIDDDDIYGGAGDDSIDGGHGSDLIYGGDGDDTINAAENFGEPELGIGEVLDATDPEPTNGLDTVYGGAGNDTIFGGDDNDVLFGGDDNDVIDGGIDNDALYGGSGEDELSGGQGSDTLDGGTGADTMYGGLDDDDFVVGAGDTAVGDHGDDVFIINSDDTDGTAIFIDGSDGGEGEDPGDTSNDDYEGAPNPTGDVLDLTNLFADGLATAGAVSYTSDDREDGTVTLEDGTVITFEEIENVVVCFTRNTMIETAAGMVAVQDLAVGDKVVTKDNGLQELRWIGSRKVAAKGNVAPILIKAGAMANTTDLMVSPQHRMLVEGWKAELLFGEREVLAAAKHLVNNDTIFVQEGGNVEYFHMLFDTHEIVFANGAASESFHPGEIGMGALAEESREEIFALFPELRNNAASFGAAARTSLKGHEAKVLADNPDFLS